MLSLVRHIQTTLRAQLQAASAATTTSTTTCSAAGIPVAACDTVDASSIARTKQGRLLLLLLLLLAPRALCHGLDRGLPVPVPVPLVLRLALDTIAGFVREAAATEMRSSRDRLTIGLRERGCGD